MFQTLTRIFLAVFSIGGLILGAVGMRNDDPWTGVLGVMIALVCLFFLLKAVWQIIGWMVKASVITLLLLALLYITGGLEFVFRPLPEGVKSYLPSLANKYPDSYSGRIAVDDGEHILIQGNRLRLYGIRVPSQTQNCYTANEEPYKCGELALAALRQLADDQSGVCYLKEKNVGQCFVGRIDISRTLVEQGYAQRTAEEYAEAEAIARGEKAGIWQGKFMILPGKTSKNAKGAFSTIFNLF